MQTNTQHGNTESERNLSPLLHPDPVGVGPLPVLHSDRAHSKISPSKLKALEICPGFQPDEGAEVHAITLAGTRCHEALDSGDDAALNDEERGWIRMCREYVADLETEDSCTEKEARLEIMDGVWGFVDCAVCHRGQGVIDLVDYKFGLSSQEDAETNPAAQAYVLGLFELFNWCHTVHVHYLYPRREEISKATYTRADVPRLRLRIQTIVERVKAGDSFNPVPDNCQYCGRKATCQALHRLVLPIATRYAERKELEVPEGDFSLVKSPEQWSRLLAYAPVLEAMADSIKRHALEFREQTGQEIPGYEMRARKGKGKILNPQIAYEVANKHGLTHEAFMACVEVSAAQLRKAAEEVAPKGQKAKFASAFEGELRDAGALEVGAESYFLGRARA